MLAILIIVIAIAIGYYFLTKPLKYWTNLGVKQGKPVLIAGDNWGTLLRKHSIADFVKYVYDMCPGTRYSGMYQFFTPTLVLKDPDLIKQITVKDFDHFTDHRTLSPENSENLFSKNLFSLKGKPWRDMRTTLSPSFTSSKMRQMFVLMTDAAENFIKYFEKQNIKGVLEIEFKDTFTRFTNDVIATTAFGIGVDSLTDRNNEFFLMGKEATNFSGFVRTIKFFFFLIFPKLFRFLKISLLGSAVTKFFLRVVTETIKTREEQNIVRPDMINLLLEARKGNNTKHEDTTEIPDTGFATAEEIEDERKSKVKMEITDFDIAAQAFVFFFAGFDSVSSLMSFTAHELAVNPDVQNRLREEINETIKTCPNGKLSYETLLKMKYLDMVMSESLRKWPNAVAVDRVCTKPYTIEPTSSDEVPVHIDVGTLLWLPIYGLHHDPQYYPDPERFDPERFNEENVKSIKPYTYIPFGSGPRNCIGSRFALLETKTIFFYILSKYEIVPTTKTKIPLQLSKKSFQLTADGGFWLGLKPLAKNEINS